MFLAVANEEQVVAEVADHRFVLEDKDCSHETGVDRACEAADIPHEVQNAVDLPSDDLQVSVELVKHGQLHVVISVVRAQGPEPRLIRPIYFAKAAHSCYIVTQIQLGDLHVVVDGLPDLWADLVPFEF